MHNHSRVVLTVVWVTNFPPSKSVKFVLYHFRWVNKCRLIAVFIWFLLEKSFRLLVLPHQILRPTMLHQRKNRFRVLKMRSSDYRFVNEVMWICLEMNMNVNINIGGGCGRNSNTGRVVRVSIYGYSLLLLFLIFMCATTVSILWSGSNVWRTWNGKEKRKTWSRRWQWSFYWLKEKPDVQ